MKIKDTIRGFDAYLADRGLRFEAIVIGGVALGLLEVISRETRDCDVLEPAIPAPVAHAAREFAADRRAAGEVLTDDWLNDGPSQLADVLPSGWRERTIALFEGTAIRFRGLGRIELLMSKVFALCDRGLDIADCIALAPTPAELAEIEPWLTSQDGNPDWPEHVLNTLRDLAGRLSHGV